MQITLKSHWLRAALHVAPKSDVRFYLNGVAIQVADGRLHVVAIGGPRLFHGWQDTDAEPVELIIPYDVAKRAVALKKDVDLVGAATSWQLGNELFTPIDGKFPDWRRVVPASYSEKPADFDPHLLTGALEAVRTWCSTPKTMYHLHLNGEEAAAAYRGPDCESLVMAVRTE